MRLRKHELKTETTVSSIEAARQVAARSDGSMRKLARPGDVGEADVQPQSFRYGRGWYQDTLSMGATGAGRCPCFV